MTFPTRKDAQKSRLSRLDELRLFNGLEPKPRWDWLLIAVLVADLGLWVGLLTWWIWR